MRPASTTSGRSSCAPGPGATAIDAADRTVTLSGQERLSWDRLLLAVGAEPRRLAAPGADLDGVHYLRDLADCDRLRAALSTGGRLVVVGAGWIGSEVAASARQLGMDVTLLERLAVPLENVLGPVVGGLYADLYRTLVRSDLAGPGPAPDVDDATPLGLA